MIRPCVVIFLRPGCGKSENTHYERERSEPCGALRGCLVAYCESRGSGYAYQGQHRGADFVQPGQGAKRTGSSDGHRRY